ncbi:MAG TPA: phosphoribosylformylglycinamidine synthase subunit PurQ, partial [Polyangiales bacterium]|nr:phosphoribosylformylglycinamidine synthase subunit PurQ [Polyangiales bacterium]
LQTQGKLLAYHDRSDGGLFVTLCEMAFAGSVGLQVALPAKSNAIATLFNEELGAVIQVRETDVDAVRAAFAQHGLAEHVHDIGQPTAEPDVSISQAGRELFAAPRGTLRALWSETTHAMQRLRDNPTCADEEQESRLDQNNPGLQPQLPFDPSEDIAAPFIARGARPRVAILREQGVNGHIEMAAAFDRAGFEAVDVHMSDILERDVELDGFAGMVACGGFSYGDVLGAGEGWAKSILFNARAREQFQRFFARSDSFTLGVCNGCQMLSSMQELIPGAERWPRFVQNRSERFEARLALVQIEDSPSLFFKGMAGARMPVAVAHGEGRAELQAADDLLALERSRLVAARFVDNHGRPTDHYPENPNGSPRGLTALTTPDGRVTILMPHPERVFRSVQLSYRPAHWGEDSPWMRMFRNARVFVG